MIDGRIVILTKKDLKEECKKKSLNSLSLSDFMFPFCDRIDDILSKREILSGASIIIFKDKSKVKVFKNRYGNMDWGALGN